jgi:hypothetical protein
MSAQSNLNLAAYFKGRAKRTRGADERHRPKIQGTSEGRRRARGFYASAAPIIRTSGGILICSTFNYLFIFSQGNVVSGWGLSS